MKEGKGMTVREKLKEGREEEEKDGGRRRGGQHRGWHEQLGPDECQP